MRVAILNVSRGDFSGGYRKYLKRIVPELREDARVERAHVILPSSAHVLAGDLGEDISLSPQTYLGTIPHVWIRKQIASVGADVLFIPSARYISGTGLPTVCMVRNMEPLVEGIGNALADSLLNAARRAAAKRACTQADRIIAVSRFVETFLSERWQVPRARLGLVYHGVDTEGPAATRPRGLPENMMEGFVFTAGSIRPARGLHDVLGAWPTIRQQHPHLLLLIAGGSTSPSTLRDLRSQVHEHGISDSVILTGHLSDAEMAWAYRTCRTFVMTSRVEACPNIALEAMSNGAVCVSTDSRPMPEFFTQAARYYSAGDPGSLATELLDSLDMSPSESRHFRSAAVMRSKFFSWRATAEGTVSELLTAIEESRTHR